MSVRDLARIGELMLHEGKVGDRQIVPVDWVARCIIPYVSADELRRYSYQWLCSASPLASRRGLRDG